MWFPRRRTQTDAVQAELSAIKEVLKEQKSSIDAATKAYRDERRDEPRIVVAPAPTDDERREACASKKNDRSTQHSMAVATWFAAIAASIAAIGALTYAHIAAKQLCSMNQTYSEIQNQTKLMRQEMIGTQGAVLLYTISINDQGLWLNVENKGHVAANNVKIKLRVSQRELPSERELFAPATYSIEKSVLPGDIPDSGEPPAFYNAIQQKWIIPGWSLKTHDALTQTKRTVRVELLISYGNGFDDPRPDPPVCKSFLSYTAANHIGGANGFSGFIPCDGFDAAVAAAMKIKREDQQAGPPP